MEEITNYSLHTSIKTDIITVLALPVYNADSQNVTNNC